MEALKNKMRKMISAQTTESLKASATTLFASDKDEDNMSFVMILTELTNRLGEVAADAFEDALYDAV